MMRRVIPGGVADRFWPRVNKDGREVRPGIGKCWEWTGGHATAGYGRMRTEGKADCTHRVSWELHNGQIPVGMQVCHRCDNPPCVNPDHLFLGTNQDNCNDKVNKGRSHRANARITEADVIDIRTLAGLAKRKELAKAFGMSLENIRDIINRRRWRRAA